ncbi:MAG: 6,7-dimethyl-8-ribityllumazine synthase [Candidatus Diapherotrites archaeon]|nr:6,7-dimethyl-8-ribityllumazine synthase [Candidatus Micrarchaeota archaeon]MBU1940045.1 6,7-dimethyl-8-ribityllumazine synthase [Candidatus Micrarchaeota archaeon]
MKLGFVVSEFNYDITSLMLQRAKEHAQFLGVEAGETIHVPGTYDMPLAINKLLKSESIDAVVTLGAVIEGDTAHDEIVAQHAARKIMDLSLEHGKPVSLGISGPKMTRMQAMKRIDGYATRAVEAAVKMAQRMK